MGTTLSTQFFTFTMASRTASRTLRAAIQQAAKQPAVQRRSFIAAANTVRAAPKVAVSTGMQQQRRGVKTVDFAGHKEDVYERADWPQEKLLEYFKNDTLALIGYGSQGHGQGLNLRDNGLNVIVGVRKDGASWKEAIQDGWVPGKNLFEVDEAIQKGSIIMNLLSDAAQSETWPRIKPMLTKGKTLYFSHGFSPVFQDVTGKAEERAVAMGVAVGSGYLYKTTFEK